MHDYYRLQDAIKKDEDALSNLKEVLDVYKHIHHWGHSQGYGDIGGDHQREKGVGQFDGNMTQELVFYNQTTENKFPLSLCTLPIDLS